MFNEPVERVLRDRDIWLTSVTEVCEAHLGEVIETVADTLFASFGRWEDAIKAAKELLVRQRTEVKVGIFWGPLTMVGGAPEGPAMCGASIFAEEWADRGVAIACVPECPEGWREYRWWPLGDGRMNKGPLPTYWKRSWEMSQ